MVARYQGTILNPYETRIRTGQTVTLKLDGSVTQSFEIDLHFDGRDFFKVFGDIWDYDIDSPDERFQVSRTFQWPAKTLPTHDSPGYSTALVSDSKGNQFRVYFSWQKILDLTN